MMRDRTALDGSAAMTTKAESATAQAPRVFVVIPVHNRLPFTRQCLEQLRLTQFDGDLRIVVVDDGSTDGTAAALAQHFPEVRVIAGDGTLWWTGAMAHAIDVLGPEFRADDYVLTLNNDTLVRPDTIACLVETSRQHGGAMVAARAREASGRAIATGARMLWGRTLAISVGDRDGDEEGLLEADVLFGRATLIPADVFRRIGNFAARAFPQYWGDSDFSLRAKRAGIAQLVCPSARVACIEDPRTTGIHFAGTREVTFAQAFRMLTSRRSNLGVFYAVRFMLTHAPHGRRVWCATAMVWRNIHAVLAVSPLRRVYLPTIRPFARIRPYIVRFIRALRVVDCRPVHVTRPELTNLGFDTDRLLADDVIAPAEVPHTYHVVLPRRRVLAGLFTYWPLVLRAYAPRARIRRSRFIRRYYAARPDRRAPIRTPESLRPWRSQDV